MSAPDGIWVHERAGDAGMPRAVFVHGSMDRSTSFAKVERRLEGWGVVRFDRRGYGRSLDAGPAADFRQQVDDLFSVLDDRPAIVVGHSFGGVIALAASVQQPDLVRAVVAYEAPMPWCDWWPRDTAGGSALAAAGADPDAAGDAAERFMRRIVGDAIWERLPPSTRAHRRAEGVALLAEMRTLRSPHAPPYEPADVTVPVIAAHGTRSVPYHCEAVRRLAGEAPRAELCVVEGASHGAHTSDPGAFADLVRRAAGTLDARW